MTKFKLLTATALTAAALAGAANAQVVTSATTSGQTRAQATGSNATTGANTFTTSIATVTAGAATQYLVATETVGSALNRSTTATTNTTALYLPGTAGVAQTIGLLGGNTYQITFSLSGGTGVNPKFTSSVPASAFTFLRSDGTALPAGATAGECDVTDTSGLAVVAGGAAGDSSVTVQITLAAAAVDTCNGTADLNSAFGGFTIVNPFTVDAIGAVSVTTNTVLALGTDADLAAKIGSAALRTRNTVAAVDGFQFVAGNVAGAAAGANASLDVAGVDRLLLGTTAPAFRTFQTSNDGISTVQYRPVTQTSGVAYAGLAAAPLPVVTYDVRVNALNNAFGTTVNSLRPGATTGTSNPVGNYVVATGGATATLAGVSSAAATITYINQGAAGTPTASLALVDQAYTVTAIPATAVVGAVTVAPERTFAAGSLVLEGTSFRAPWVTSPITTFNTVLRISNSGTRAIGPVELSLTSALNTTATSANVCRSTTLAELASIPVNGELALSSADFAVCFGEFRRGDISVRILDTVPANAVTAKLRVVNPNGSVAEQSLNSFSGSGTTAAPF